jgi:hemoglobin
VAVVQGTFYEAVGGHPTFLRLVEVFYSEVADDERLRAMYPEADLGPAAGRLRMFLEQYWGGPTTYSDQRGHPRLRMRHAPYPVTHDARVRWLTHMRTAVDTVVAEGLLPSAAEPVLWDYLQRAALSMVNTLDEPGTDVPS